jgi:peptidoglycan/LPS O-acetylase OafA/YrhL
MNRLAWLDGLRAIAVALVLMGHAKLAFQYQPGGMGGILLRIFNAHVGVQIFFVISGFIITLLLREKEADGDISLKAFWRRRAFRILPALWLFLLTLAFLHVLGVLSIDQSSWLGSLFFLRNHVGGGWFTGHLWSLGVEAQFYLLWPVLMAYLPRARLDLALGGAIALAVTSRFLAALLGAPELSFYSLHGNLDLLMFGVMAAIRVSGRHEEATAHERQSWHDWLAMKWTWPALVLLALAFAFLMSTRWSPWAMVAQPLLTGLLVSLAIVQASETPKITRMLGYMPLTILGLWSYSLYLWQQLFLAPAGAWPENTWMRENQVGMLLALLLAAPASYYLIERTFNRLAHKRSSA